MFGKSVLKYMPLIGWMWVFCDSIFLRREWEKDKKTIMRDLEYINASDSSALGILKRMARPEDFVVLKVSSGLAKS